jgi:uncharacterized protein
MKIPYEQLNQDTLQAVIEEFVSRDGTDYGEEEVSLQEKMEQVMEQLKKGKSFLVFDEKTKSCNILGCESL